MAIAYSGNNTYVPSLEASGKLVVEYSRNISKYKLNRYVGQRKVDKQLGYYCVINADEASRIVNVQDLVWPDGNDMPEGNMNTSEHDFSNTFTCQRYVSPFTLGYLAVEQAAWPILAQHAAAHASKSMTLRSMLALDTLTNATWGSNTGTATALGGGFWSAGTSTAPYIMKTLFAAAQTIQVATNSVVQPSDLQLVIGPALAAAMAESAEIHDYVKSSVWTRDVLTGGAGFGLNEWGLPPNLYGFPVVVEDTVRVSNKKGASRSAAYYLGSNVAYLLARPEGLQAGFGSGPSFNTLTQWTYEDFTVESMNDFNNRRYLGRVVQNIGFSVTAPASGFYITATLS